MPARFFIPLLLAAAFWLSTPPRVCVAEADLLSLSQQMVDLQKAGRYAEALPLAERTVRLAEEELGAEHSTVAIYLDHLGMLHHRLGHFAAAEAPLRRALAIRERGQGPDTAAVAISLDHLAAVYASGGRHQRAHELLTRALRIREKVLGPRHPVVGMTFARLAGLAHARGDDEMAQAHYQNAIRIEEEGGEPALNALWKALNLYAQFLRDTHRVLEATHIQTRADTLKPAAR